MRVRTTQRVNLRHGKADPNAELKGEILPGFEFEAEPVDGVEHQGVSRWYRDGNGDFLWGGGVAVVGDSQVTDQDPEHAFPPGSTVTFPPSAINYQEMISGVGALEATGAGVRIAVLDSGLAFDHPAFSHVDHLNLTETTGEGEVRDQVANSHGSHTAGLIGARFCQGRGIRGVAPRATLHSCRVHHSEGGVTARRVTAGIRWALERKVDVISASFSSRDSSQELGAAIEKAAKEGVIIVTAAGDDGGLERDPLPPPAQFDQCISVGAVSMGYWEMHNTLQCSANVDFILASRLLWSAARPVDGAYRKLEGSSMATALIAGISALIIEARQLDNRDIARVSRVRTELAKLAVPVSRTATAQRVLQIMLPAM